VLFLLGHGVPADWIEQMDEETMLGWVWNGPIFDGAHEWNDAAGHPVEKPKK